MFLEPTVAAPGSLALRATTTRSGDGGQRRPRLTISGNASAAKLVKQQQQRASMLQGRSTEPLLRGPPTLKRKSATSTAVKSQTITKTFRCQRNRSVKGTGFRGDMLSTEPLSDWHDLLDPAKVIKLSVSTQNFFKRQQQKNAQTLRLTLGGHADPRVQDQSRRATPQISERRGDRSDRPRALISAQKVNEAVHEKLSGQRLKEGSILFGSARPERVAFKQGFAPTLRLQNPAKNSKSQLSAFPSASDRNDQVPLRPLETQ